MLLHGFQQRRDFAADAVVADNFGVDFLAAVNDGGVVATAQDGADLQTGDRIVTGATDRALVTFLDGTTITVEPGTDIVVQQADVNTSAGSSVIDIHINLGTVWARVVSLLDPGSHVSLSSSTATAVVHDGLPGAQKRLDGSFQCWTFAGDMTVLGPSQSSAVIEPQQTVVVQPASAVGTPQPIHFNASTLQITTSGGVLPLVEMPDSTRVAGFVSPGVEVNQVFASSTSTSTSTPDGAQDSHVVVVPGGDVGPFTLVLQGLADSAFTVDITGWTGDTAVYTQRLSGTIMAGERLSATVTQTLVDGTSAGNPRTALIAAGIVSPLAPFADALPGHILLSPSELASITTSSVQP